MRQNAARTFAGCGPCGRPQPTDIIKHHCGGRLQVADGHKGRTLQQIGNDAIENIYSLYSYIFLISRSGTLVSERATYTYFSRKAAKDAKF